MLGLRTRPAEFEMAQGRLCQPKSSKWSGHQLARQRHHVLDRTRELLAAVLQRFRAVALLIVQHLLQNQLRFPVLAG